jgi:CheY-like chemotaxis protein
MDKETRRLPPILIVEDSDEDFDILQMTFQQFDVRNPLLRVAEGRLVTALLEKRRATRQELPGLIILDLNLIGVDGREVLRRLKRDPQFVSIPVLVFSTSGSPRDINTSYAEGAAAYSIKPVNLERLERFVKAVKMFWLEHAVLPTHADLPDAGAPR